MLESRIEELKRIFLNEAYLVEGMIEKSIKGLLKKERELLIEVIEEDEPKLDELEIEIDKMVTNIIALHCPQAKNLRIVLMILQMNNDLERIGDLAVNISESSLYLIERPSLKPLIEIPRMAEEGLKMLRDSITSFIKQAPELAKDVIRRDDVVDGLRDQILRELITYMCAEPSTIERAVHLIRISRNLERLADLATNIAEDVIFMAEGKIYKHHEDEGA